MKDMVVTCVEKETVIFVENEMVTMVMGETVTDVTKEMVKVFAKETVTEVIEKKLLHVPNIHQAICVSSNRRNSCPKLEHFHAFMSTFVLYH